MRKSIKRLLLIAPYLIGGLLIGALVIWGDNPEFFPATSGLYTTFFLFLLLTILLILYLVLVIRADHLDGGAKAAWILALLFAFWVAIPFFWYFNWDKF